ncbi:hypothetical protein [Streptomyces sp. NPDC126514]|uniref:hypothetical protein n=1 Tax=Streptomyces sp. NPDC126514 TaxID=3155210 RepID=UPI00331BF172
MPDLQNPSKILPGDTLLTKLPNGYMAYDNKEIRLRPSPDGATFPVYTNLEGWYLINDNQGSNYLKDGDYLSTASTIFLSETTISGTDYWLIVNEQGQPIAYEPATNDAEAGADNGLDQEEVLTPEELEQLNADLDSDPYFKWFKYLTERGSEADMTATEYETLKAAVISANSEGGTEAGLPIIVERAEGDYNSGWLERGAFVED